MAKIDRLEDLPGWFNLNRYSECKELKAAEWAAILRIRKNIINALDNLNNAGLSCQYILEKLKNCTEELTTLRNDPLNRDTGYSWASVTADYEPLCQSPVRRLTFNDLVKQYYQDEQDIYSNGLHESQLERWELITKSVCGIAPEQINDLPVGPILETREALLVDLEASDPVLTAAFSAWLRKARAQQQDNDSKRESPAYSKWYRYGLLPYIDLRIWEMETENQIPHHIMAQAVGYQKGGDSFRKTVPKLADELMRSLAELEALAATEGEPEKPSP